VGVHWEGEKEAKGELLCGPHLRKVIG
jgi:hypothetical protein